MSLVLKHKLERMSANTSKVAVLHLPLLRKAVRFHLGVGGFGKLSRGNDIVFTS